MCKKIVAFFLSIVMIFTMLPSMVVTAEATAPAKVSQEEALARINNLIDAFVTEGRTYFTVDGKACTTNGGYCSVCKDDNGNPIWENHEGNGGCSHCNIKNVIYKAWFKQKVGSHVPQSLAHSNYTYFTHWYTNDSNGYKNLGVACCGFANFAGWYIFSQKTSDRVKFEPKVINNKRAVEEFSYDVLKANAKPGDILRVSNGQYSGSLHSAIFISCDKNYVKVLDCNSNYYHSEKDDRNPSSGIESHNAEIRVHYYKYSDYNYVTISRAENYDVESTQTPTTTYTKAADVGITQVDQKVNALIASLDQKYFTSDGKVCYDSRKEATRCSIEEVTKATWFKTALNSYVPSKAMLDNSERTYFAHWFTNDSDGWQWLGSASCGFANFAGWYIFSSKATDGVIFKPMKINASNAQEDFSYTIMKNAKKGDLLRLKKASDSSSSHSAVFLSCDSNGITVLDCNSDVDCKIKTHKISYSDFKWVTISRAENYKETQLSTPTISVENVASTGKPKITWKAVTGAYKYRVERATTENGTYKKLDETTKLSWTDSSAVAGTCYYYKVSALAEDSTYNSKLSKAVSSTCDLSMPTNVICSNTVSGAIQIQWDAVEGADYYQLFRSSSENGEYVLHSDERIIDTSYVDTDNDVSGAVYYYKVKALMTDKTAATSAYSEYVSCAFGQAQKGDVNLDGEVNADDLTALARHVAKIETLTDDYALLNADVDDNGSLSADDLTKLARYVAKIIPSL